MMYIERVSCKQYRTKRHEILFNMYEGKWLVWEQGKTVLDGRSFDSLSESLDWIDTQEEPEESDMSDGYPVESHSY